jgi:ribosomal protein S15P/S13E
VEAIEAMLDLREPGKALFLVVDEVSQYVHQVDDRMLKLQTFVAALGQQLRGKVWLLATGQQKLDDAAETGTIVKLKDRFPPSLRVHLASTNIRDVVHKRLLKKTPHHDPLLRELFNRHRSELKLYAYDCHSITEEDFVEVYPMLPGQVDLLMQITTNLRAHSRRTQSDDHAIRGLLQLLGELFREQRLGERELGALVTLDAIYEVQASALDADVQTTLARLLAHPEVREDTLALRAAKAVALLELIQESTPTSPELVAQCLYARLGQGDETPQVRAALERLKALGLLSFSEKQGYKLQSSAGQEWQAERMTLSATGEERSALVRTKLKNLIALDQRPKLGARPFPLGAWYSDGKQASDVRLQDPRDDAAVTFDFRFLGTKDERSPAVWVQESDREALRDRILWVAGDGAIVTKLAGELASSQRMIDRYLPRRDSLSTSKQRLLLDEQAHAEELEGALARAVSEAYLRGAVYFRGGVLVPTEHGTSFSTALQAIAVKYLPAIFPHFTDIAVTDGELSQLLAPTLSGPSTKFFEEGLGILSLDAGKYVPTCQGTEPTRILAYITEGGGASGAAVLQRFARPPYGYPADVVRACLAGLLRAGKIRIRPATGPDITSIRDPGTQDLFRKVSELRSADVLTPKEGGVVARDRVAICAFFQKHLGLDVPRSDDDIADAVFQQFPAQRDKLRVVEGLLERVPGRPPLPPALAKLAKALEDCRRSRQVEETVLATRKHLDTLGDGLEQLGMYVHDLGEDNLAALRDAAEIRDHHLSQLTSADARGEVEAAATLLQDGLAAPRPWREAAQLAAAARTVQAHYGVVRAGILAAQGAEVEAARDRVRTRAGFERLSAVEAQRVLRPITEALPDTTAQATAPSLVELRDRLAKRLAEAEERAHELLDDALSDEDKGQRTVVRVEARVRGRVIDSREQLEALFDELRERIGPHLDAKAQVRLA